MTNQLKSILLILGDILLLYLALFITTFIYKDLEYHPVFFAKHIAPFSLVFSAWIIIFFIEGMYSLRTFKQTGFIVSLIRGSILNATIAFIFFYLVQFDGITPRKNIFILVTLSSALIFIYRKLYFKLFSYKGLKIKTYAIGDVNSIDEIKQNLQERPYLGFEIVKSEKEYSGDIPKGTKLIAIDRKLFSDKEIIQKIISLLNNNYDLIDLTQLSELITGKIPVSALDESWFLQNCGLQSSRGYWLSKNILDRITALIIFIPVSLIYIFLIPFLLIVSGRPIFYSQIRTGIRNKPFRIYKLRTMTVDAEENGAKWATPKDARVTPIGKFLRMTRLDEFPQLWNILNGDMSLVGPRPERPEIIAEKLETTIPFYSYRHLVKPGVTGWAQVNFRYGYSEQDSMEKLQYDLYYIKNKSIWLDIKIILKTIKTVITGMGH